MGVLKNGKGRPSNKTKSTRRRILIALFLIVFIAFFAIGFRIAMIGLK